MQQLEIQRNRINYRIFLFVFVVALTLVWREHAVLNCDVLSPIFLKNLSLLLENIINILKPTWPLTALLIFIISVAVFRKQMAAKIEHVSKISKDGVQFDQPVNAIDVKRTELNFKHQPLNANVLAHARPEDPPVLLDEMRRIQILVTQARAEDITSDQILGEFTRTLAQNNILLHFEKAFRLIYGGQIRLLRLLAIENSEGIPLELINLYYEQELKTYPEMGSHQPTALGYINFLVGCLFINIVDTKIIITVSGRAFLEWLDENNLIEQMKPY